MTPRAARSRVIGRVTLDDVARLVAAADRLGYMPDPATRAPDADKRRTLKP